jgi:regulatory protein YycH of two-component signal transduction system YycFG
MSGMNKEPIKSAILAVLVIISLFFTWNVWSLRPFNEELQNQILVERDPINEETKRLFEVVKPQQLYIHDHEAHYSTLNADYLNDLWREMQGWKYNYSNEGSFATSVTKGELDYLIHEDEGAKLELTFYERVPLETFQSMIEWDTEINGITSFDRILLKVAKANEVQKVYFISDYDMKIVELTVNRVEASQFVSNLYEKRRELAPYFSFNEGGKSEILLPEREVKLSSYKYLSEDIEGEKFKETLFSNPQIVKQDVNSSKNRYTDGIRELSISPSTHSMMYVNPTLRDSNPIEANALIEQSIAFINDHGGWTDDYVLYDILENNQEIEFIMTIESIPVINSKEKPFGMTKISQRWSQNEIAKYERPSYHLGSRFLNGESTLRSGRAVVEFIKGHEQLKKERIKKIYIAYEFSASDRQEVVEVSPVWCIELNDGTLMKINQILERPKGDENGLE